MVKMKSKMHCKISQLLAKEENALQFWSVADEQKFSLAFLAVELFGIGVRLLIEAKRMLEKLFALKEKGSNAKTEVIAGILPLSSRWFISCL